MEYQCDAKKAGHLEFRCYFQLAMMVIGGKWKPKVLFHLARNGAVRFGVLRRGVIGITEKMLIQSLKELEKDGLVNRKVYREVPPKVEYSLTALGQSFIPVLNAMYEWGKSYASFLIAKQNNHCEYKTGKVYDNIDDLVRVNEAEFTPTLQKPEDSKARALRAKR